jgi:hypothetical protein
MYRFLLLPIRFRPAQNTSFPLLMYSCHGPVAVDSVSFYLIFLCSLCSIRFVHCLPHCFSQYLHVLYSFCYFIRSVSSHLSLQIAAPFPPASVKRFLRLHHHHHHQGKEWLVPSNTTKLFVVLDGTNHSLPCCYQHNGMDSNEYDIKYHHLHRRRRRWRWRCRRHRHHQHQFHLPS